jgi:hypothetical protein
VYMPYYLQVLFLRVLIRCISCGFEETHGVMDNFGDTLCTQKTL